MSTGSVHPETHPDSRKGVKDISPLSRLVHDTDCVLVVSHAVDAQSNHDSRGRVPSLWMFPLARPALDLI